MKSKNDKKIFTALFMSGFLFSVSATISIAESIYVKEIAREKENFALQIIGTIRACQMSYSNKHQGRFAKNFKDLTKAGCLDEDHFSEDFPGTENYIFSMKAVEPTKLKPAFYSINADPSETDDFYSDELKHFYIDSTLGTFKSTEENRQAKADDSSI